MRPILLIILLYLSAFVIAQDSQVFITRSGNIHFLSDAPLELIEASSDQLQGAVDLEKRTFAFVISNNTFKGFNSPLQQEHFYENYIETHKFPRSSFEGKIIEDYDFSADGEYEVRAKGILNIHGKEQERIIRSTLVREGEQLHIISEFSVPLEDHDIKIPRIVYQKIAEVIKVNIDASLQQR